MMLFAPTWFYLVVSAVLLLEAARRWFTDLWQREEYRLMKQEMIAARDRSSVTLPPQRIEVVHKNPPESWQSGE